MAFPIPNLPTDNLYKFMALLGIVIIVASYIALEASEARMNEQSVLTSQVSGKVAAETGLLRDQEEEIAMELKEMTSEAQPIIKNPKPEDKPIAEQLIQALKEQRSRIVELYKAHEEAQIDLADADAQLKRSNIAISNAEWAGYMFKMGTWAGYVLMVCGFGLWWYKVQRHLDAKLKRESGLSFGVDNRRRNRQGMLGRRRRAG